MRLIYFVTSILMGLVIIFLCWYISALQEDLARVQNRPPVRLIEYIQEDNPVSILFEVPIEVEVPVEVIREVPVKLRWFESIEELKTWLGQIDKLPISLKPNPDGVTQLWGACEDVAIFLQDRAEEDGYKMSIEMLGESEYFKWYGERLDEGQLHAINSAIIGNEVWFIDLWGDKVWPAVYLD